MTQHKIIYVVFFVFLASCNNNSSSEIFIHSFKRTQTEKFLLEIKKENIIKHYFYSNQNDTIKDLHIIYNLNKDYLITDQDTFYPIKKSYKTNDYEYQMYQPKEVKSHLRTLVFHKNYGILLSSALGADYLFLKDSLTSFNNEAIFKEIILELNNLN